MTIEKSYEKGVAAALEKIAMTGLGSPFKKMMTGGLNGLSSSVSGVSKSLNLPTSTATAGSGNAVATAAAIGN